MNIKQHNPTQKRKPNPAAPKERVDGSKITYDCYCFVSRSG